MADLVDDDVQHQMLERLVPTLCPFVEDRAAELVPMERQ